MQFRVPPNCTFFKFGFFVFFWFFNGNMAMCALAGEPASKDGLKPGQPPDVGITSLAIRPKTWADVAQGPPSHRVAYANARESGEDRADEQADRWTCSPPINCKKHCESLNHICKKNNTWEHLNESRPNKSNHVLIKCNQVQSRVKVHMNRWISFVKKARSWNTCMSLLQPTPITS